jgi:aspartate aminotransferase
MEHINLASGSTYFNTPLVASQAAIKAIQAHKTFYGLTEGTIALRTAIAHRYQNLNQATVSLENILITAGTKQALFNILSNILNPGDEVIVPVPNWFGLHQVLEVVKAKIVFWPTAPENNYDLRPGDLEKLITPKTRLVLISNPCNPTGRLYQKPEIEGLVKVLAQHPKIYLLSDEIYDLVFYDRPVPSLTEFPDPQGRHIVVNGFSKAFAMSGWRIGYLIVPPDLFAASLAFQGATLAGVSEFVQAAAQAILENVPEILPPMLRVLQQNRDLMTDFLKEQNIKCFTPEAAYFVFPDFRSALNHTVNSTARFAQYLKANQAIEILPGESFGAPGYARLSFAIPLENLNLVFIRLRQAFQEMR